MANLKKYNVALSQKHQMPINITVYARDEEEALINALNDPHAKEQFKDSYPGFNTIEEIRRFSAPIIPE